MKIVASGADHKHGGSGQHAGLPQAGPFVQTEHDVHVLDRLTRLSMTDNTTTVSPPCG
jgi:hypothetical protein